MVPKSPAFQAIEKTCLEGLSGFPAPVQERITLFLHSFNGFLNPGATLSDDQLFQVVITIRVHIRDKADFMSVWQMFQLATFVNTCR